MVFDLTTYHPSPGIKRLGIVVKVVWKEEIFLEKSIALKNLVASVSYIILILKSEKIVISVLAQPRNKTSS